ncbi:hypothetical protein [Dietzia kunjamensis]|uniref:hypothetical protein n=1 Tax=Dietzia kunjamensis TaxID=322509 RepID=UPI00388E4CEE
MSARPKAAAEITTLRREWDDLDRVVIALDATEALIRLGYVDQACGGCLWGQHYKPALREVFGEHNWQDRQVAQTYVLDRLHTMDPAGGHGVDQIVRDTVLALLPGQDDRRRQDLRLESVVAREDVEDYAATLQAVQVALTGDDGDSSWEPVDLSQYLTDDARELDR